MSKTTKPAQIAGNEAVRKQPPNTVTAPGKAGVFNAFDGVPEHVPELTFIVQARRRDDGFINGANTYHANCGLAPQTITSIENLVQRLDAENGHLGRIRIVTHAHPTNMAVAMFENSNLFHTEKAFLRDFAKDDLTGLYGLLDLPVRGHFAIWDAAIITNYVRSGNAAVLQPFGLRVSGDVSGEVRQLTFFCVDAVAVNTNRIRRNNRNLSNAERNAVLGTVRLAIEETGRKIVGKSFGGPAVTQLDLDALESVITAARPEDFGFPTVLREYTVEAGPDAIDPFAILQSALAAVRNGLRDRLNRVRRRFDESSVIDIRGCRVGQDLDYLQAVREFFGRADHMPKVTGPRWFQGFGSSAFRFPGNNADLHGLLHIGAGAAAMREGFEDWMKRARVHPLHRDFWIMTLGGGVVSFCLLAWRAKLPKLPLQTPGLSPFLSMTFGDAIARMAVLFDVPAASTPAAATLNSVNAFVTGPLASYAPSLLVKVDGTTSTSKLNALHAALKTIDNDLGQTFVPTTPPTPLTAANITSYQTALIGYIESNRLAAVRAFMTATRQRITDTANPGLYYYMVNAGLPVFIFSRYEAGVNNHMVNVLHNILVVHQTYRDVAFRQWPPLLWAEPLPPTNRIATLRANQDDGRRFAMVIEDEIDAAGNSRVAACPHPDYMDQIVSVPKP